MPSIAVGESVSTTLALAAILFFANEGAMKYHKRRQARDDREPNRPGHQPNAVAPSFDLPCLIEKLKALRSGLNAKDRDCAHRARADLNAFVGSFSGMEDMLREFQSRCGSDAHKNKHVEDAIRYLADIRTKKVPEYNVWDTGVATQGVIGELERWHALLSETMPDTDRNLIYQADGAEFYDIPKSTLSKAARKKPSEPGYLWSDAKGRRRWYRKADLERLARSRQKLKGS